jgi:hypothetical protein
VLSVVISLCHIDVSCRLKKRSKPLDARIPNADDDDHNDKE